MGLESGVKDRVKLGLLSVNGIGRGGAGVGLGCGAVDVVDAGAVSGQDGNLPKKSAVRTGRRRRCLVQLLVGSELRYKPGLTCWICIEGAGLALRNTFSPDTLERKNGTFRIFCVTSVVVIPWVLPCHCPYEVTRVLVVEGVRVLVVGADEPVMAESAPAG